MGAERERFPGRGSGIIKGLGAWLQAHAQEGAERGDPLVLANAHLANHRAMAPAERPPCKACGASLAIIHCHLFGASELGFRLCESLQVALDQIVTMAVSVDAAFAGDDALRATDRHRKIIKTHLRALAGAVADAIEDVAARVPSKSLRSMPARRPPNYLLSAVEFYLMDDGWSAKEVFDFSNPGKKPRDHDLEQIYDRIRYARKKGWVPSIGFAKPRA